MHFLLVIVIEDELLLFSRFVRISSSIRDFTIEMLLCGKLRYWVFHVFVHGHGVVTVNSLENKIL